MVHILSVSGENFARGTPGYEAARLDSVWTKLKPDRYPAHIVRARTVEDVREVVRFANRSGLPVAVKGSGHNFVASFLQDDAILLDLSQLNTTEIARSVAVVGPGVRSGELAAFLAKHGRAFPSGHNANVGLGGYLLGGGMGWNGASWGQMACHNILSVDVVTAAGELVTADESHHSELFWAARGAGPYFPGIVVAFRLATYDYPVGMRASVYVFPHESAPVVAQWLSNAARTGPSDIEYFLVLEATETIGAGEPRRHNYCRAYVTCFLPDAAHSLEALRRVADAVPTGALEKTECLPVSFETLYADSITGPVRRIANDTIWTEDGVAATLALAGHALTAPSAATVSVVDFRRAPKGAEDSAARAWASDFLSWGAQWDDPADDAANLAWMEQSVALLEPYRVGCYVNETDYLRRPERLRYCYSDDVIRRILRIRQAYDPRDLFRPLVDLRNLRR